MEEFATIQHSLNNENSFDEERVKNFLLSLISDSRFHHLTFRIPFFKIKILRRGNRIRRFHHRSIFHKFCERKILRDELADPSERRREEKNDRSLASVENCKAAGLLPRKELRVEDGKTMEKGRGGKKKVHSSREISLEWPLVEVDDAILDERKRISSSHRG